MNLIINNLNQSEVLVGEDENGNTVVTIQDPFGLKRATIGDIITEVDMPNSELNKQMRKSFDINHRR